MSLLFTVPFNGVTVHVLHVRNRTAFLARELGEAAGHADGGQPFLDLMVHEWAPSLDEDDDVAQLVGAELEAIKREVPLPQNTTMALVLFATGAERALLRSHARYARSLVGFLHAEVLSRVITIQRGEKDGGEQGGAPAGPNPPRSVRSPGTGPKPTMEPAANGSHWWGVLVRSPDARQQQPDAAELREPSPRQIASFEAINDLARELHDLALIGGGFYGALRIEAVEELLGHPLRTAIPPFDDGDDDSTANQPFAA